MFIEEIEESEWEWEGMKLRVEETGRSYRYEDCRLLTEDGFLSSSAESVVSTVSPQPKSTAWFFPRPPQPVLEEDEELQFRKGETDEGVSCDNYQD